jgi:hypothetical protein
MRSGWVSRDDAVKSSGPPWQRARKYLELLFEARI